jgi:N-acetylglutamate synthase
MHMQIVPMVIADYACVKDLWRECQLRDEPEDQKEEIEALLNSAQASGFVARKNGSLVGAVLCGSDGRYGYIHHLAVSPKMRRQGIGQSMVAECLRFLHRRHVLVMIRSANEVGHHFWKHLQFQGADWIRLHCIRTR